jgi:hypothetical protein
MTIIKLIPGSEQTLSSNSANVALSSLGGAKLVRCLSISNTNVLITQQSTFSNGSVSANLATITIAAGETLLIEKGVTDLLISSANNSVVATAIAYKSD